MEVFSKRQFHEKVNQSKSSSAEISSIYHSHKCKRLQREHQMLVKLNHPSIVKCDIQFYQNEERCCIRLEKAECDFLEYLNHFFPIRTKAFFRTQVSLLKNIAQAIDYLHEKDYVHNDIKLENCLLFVQADKASIYQSKKKKTQNYESKPSKQQQMLTSCSQFSNLQDSQQITTTEQGNPSSPSGLSSSCSLASQTNQDRKDSLEGGETKTKKSSQKGKLVLKLADFEFSCSTKQCSSIEYFKSWKQRNRTYMSPELLELCNTMDVQQQHCQNQQQTQQQQSQQVSQTSGLCEVLEKEIGSSLQNQNSMQSLISQFKRVCSLYCEDSQQSSTSFNGEEEECSDSQLTISTDHTVGSNFTAGNNDIFLQSTEKLQNHIKVIDLKSNDVFCFGILFFSSIFGVYPFQKEASKSDPIYSLIFQERWSEFWFPFESRIQDLLAQEFPAQQVVLIKDLIEKMLSANPQVRLDISGILKHPYFASQSKSSK